MKKEDKLFNDISKLIEAIKPLYDQIDEMVKMGIITQEQADDMTGATIDKMDAEEKWEKIKHAKVKTLTKKYTKKKEL